MSFGTSSLFQGVNSLHPRRSGISTAVFLFVSAVANILENGCKNGGFTVFMQTGH